MKLKKIAQKSLSIFLATVLMVSGLAINNGTVLRVNAEEGAGSTLRVTQFATPEQLMSSDNFALHSDTGSGVAQKVYFGMNGDNQQTWYIAGGEDHDGDGNKDSIVLLCDPALPMATNTMFENDLENDKTYSAEWGCTYETAPSKVYPNHYGASDLRLTTLKGLETSAFTTSEQSMMHSTKIYTADNKQKNNGNAAYIYYTEDKLYAAYGDYDDYKYITVGANSATSLNGGIKVSLSSVVYENSDLGDFWLRAPANHTNFGGSELYVYYGKVVNFNGVNWKYSVVPAFRLNLSSVLFASAATAATSNASLTDAMTFRVDGADEISSKITCTEDGVAVDYKDTDGQVFLYVQDADSVYSVEITKDTTVALSSMIGITSMTGGNTKIWLEKSKDNIAYAVMTTSTVGTTLTDKSTKAKYKVTGTGEVSYVAPTSKKATSVTIADTVTINGVKYKITSIKANAFKNNKNIKKVVIGKNVKTIGKEAFRGCSKLKSINIKSKKLKTVGKNAFKSIKTSAKIKVPSSKLKNYKKLLKNKGQSKKVKITK